MIVETGKEIRGDVFPIMVQTKKIYIFSMQLQRIGNGNFKLQKGHKSSIKVVNKTSEGTDLN